MNESLQRPAAASPAPGQGRDSPELSLGRPAPVGTAASKPSGGRGRRKVLDRHLIQPCSDCLPGRIIEGVATIPLTDAKARLNELVEQTALTHERVTITRHGRPAVVLIAVEDLEAMEETLFWQAQPGVHQDIDSGRAAAPADLYEEAVVRRRYGVGSAR